VNISGAACSPFTGWLSNLPAATNCQSYSGSTTVLGGVSPYAWARTGGSLPNGISFCDGNTSATCNLIGTPLAAPGTYNFTEQVTDSCATGSQQTSQSFSITVNADSCYSGGVELRNNTGTTRYYKKNGGGCTAWPATGGGRDIDVLTTDSYVIYTDAACTAQCATTNYCGQKTIDAAGDNDCRTQMTSTCTFSDR
jgi:hypothetical protein